jgi:putative peptidoglycan lipid II flippase
VSALASATIVAMLPYALFGEAISKSVYTGFAEAGATGNMERFAEYIGKVLYLGGWLIIPASVGIASLSENIIYFLYFGGKFTMADVTLVAYATMFYAFRYLFTSLYIPLNNSLVALRKGHISMWLAAIFVPINIVLNWILGFNLGMGAPGFALATAITSTLMKITVLFILLSIIRRPIPAQYISGVLKVILASIVMGISLILLKRITGIGRLYTTLLIGTGTVIYGLTLLILRDEETIKIMKKLARRQRM